MQTSKTKTKTSVDLKKADIKHYGLNLAEFLACNNSFVQKLIEAEDWDDAYAISAGVADTLGVLEKVHNKRYRKSHFLFHAILASTLMGDVKTANILITAIKKEINELGSGTFNVKNFSRLTRFVKSVERDQNAPKPLAPYFG